MTRRPIYRDEASRAERLSDAAVHYFGLGAVSVAVPLLIVLAALRRGDAPTVTAVAIYGACFVAMLLCSAIYNIAYGSPLTGIFKRLDHTAIYLKIAGTYTPLVALTGTGQGLLAGLWAAALGGSSLKVLAPDRLRWLGIALYIGMGWIGVIAGIDVMRALTPASLAFVVSGGLLYTIGVAFFLWEGLPYHNTIWHVFVLVASAFLYTAILLEVLVVIEV